MSGEDALLIERTLGGDRAAFGELVGRYQDRLYNTAFRLVGHADDARDVVQDALVSAYQGLGRFKGDSQFFTWLYRIAVNAAISHRRKRQVVLTLNGASRKSIPEPVDDSPGHRPGDALEREEEEQILQNALLRLSPEFRAAMVLRDIDGMQYEEIAELLDIPIGTVRSRIHRARMELRSIIAGVTAEPAVKREPRP